MTQKCPFPSTDPIDTAKTVIQADVTGAKYRGMLQTLPELYRTNGMTRLYSGGLARTFRTCGAFFIVRRSLLLTASIYAMPLSLTAAHPLQVLTHYLLTTPNCAAGLYDPREVHPVQGEGQMSNSATRTWTASLALYDGIAF